MASYLGLLATGRLAERTAALHALAHPCRLCPRECGTDRPAGERGGCGAGAVAAVASWGPHFGEELELSGWRGSGAIFFSGCNLECTYCQNWDVSRLRTGNEVSARELADIMLQLQEQRCHNINLVTPTPHLPAILAALELAAADGLALPLVYNCGGYESEEALAALAGVIDIYLPDMKYGGDEAGQLLSGVSDYAVRSRAAVREMRRQVGDLRTDGEGLAFRGLMIRHLVLPGGLCDTGAVCRFIADSLSVDTYVNIMPQYRPQGAAARTRPLNRRPTRSEYEEALAAARAAGLRRLAQ